jgi:hypothetical protein
MSKKIFPNCSGSQWHAGGLKLEIPEETRRITVTGSAMLMRVDQFRADALKNS